MDNENVSTSSSRSSKSDTGSNSTDSSVLVERAKKRNPRVAIANNNDTLDDAENLEDILEETPINAPIDIIAETIASIASTSKTASASSPDGMISFRGPSSQIYRKGTLMPTATFEACKLLMKQKKNIQETDKQPRRSARNKNNND